MCESRNLQDVEYVKTGPKKHNPAKDMKILLVWPHVNTFDEGSREHVVVFQSLDIGEVGDVLWGWCINTNPNMNAWNKGIWVPTTEQPHNKWGHRQNYIIFGVAFDGWLFIREACQEFKGCLRFKDFLQLMRLILDFQVMRHVEVIPRDTSVLLDSEWDSACCVHGWKIVIAKRGKMHQHVLQAKIVKSNYIHDILKWGKFVEAPRQLDIFWNMFMRGNLLPCCLQPSGIFWYRMMFLVRGQRTGANRSYHYQEYRRKGNCQLHGRFRLISVSHDWRQVLKWSLTLSSWSFQKPSVSFEVFCMRLSCCHHLDIMKFCQWEFLWFVLQVSMLQKYKTSESCS